MCGKKKSKTKETVNQTTTIAPITAQEEEDRTLQDFVNSTLLKEAGYERYDAPAFSEAAAKQYINDNPEMGYDPDTQMYDAWEHYLNYGQGEGRKWTGTKSGYRERAPTEEEKTAKAREKEIEDIQYRKLKGELTPEEEKLIDEQYESARTTGKSDLNADFMRMLDEANIGEGRLYEDMGITENRLYDDINKSAREAAAERGLAYGDTPIAGEREKSLIQLGQDVSRNKRLLGEDVTRNKRLLGEDFSRSLADLDTNLLGAKAGAKVNVMQSGQLFAQGLREFQANLKQQANTNRMALSEMYGNRANDLASIRSRNVTTSGTRTGTSTISDPGGDFQSILSGIGSLTLGAAKLLAETLMAIFDPEEQYSPDSSPVATAATGGNGSGSGGFNIRGLLEGIGHMASGTGAALKGDNNYFMRLDALEEETKRREKHTEIENRRMQMQARESGMNAFKTAISLRELGLDDKQAAIAAKRLKPDFDQGLGGMQTDEAEIAELIRGGRGLDNLLKVYTSLPKDFFQENPDLRNKPAQLKTINEEYEKQRGEKAFTDIAALIQENPQGIDKNITRQKLSELHPDAKYMNDDQLLQLNKDFGFPKLKPAKLMEKEEEGKIVEGRQEERQRDSQAFQVEHQARSQAFQAGETSRQIAASEARVDRSLGQRQIEEERRERQQRQPLPSQVKQLSGNRNAIKAIDDYEKTFDEFVAESPKGGAATDIWRGTIAKNAKATKAADLVPLPEGRTPAERKMAGAYNALVGNIRSLTDEVGVLTDMDAVRILASFDPSQKREQVKANLAARRKTHTRAFETTLEDAQAMGKDVSGFTGKVTNPTASPAQATPTMRYNPVTKKVEPIR